MLTYSNSFTDLIPYLLILFFLYTIVCRWFLFRKMQLRAWTSLIPFYSKYKIFKCCWRGWIYIVLLLLTLICATIVPLTGYLDMNMPLPGYVKSNIEALTVILWLLIQLLMYKRLAFAFGHDIPFLMGLLFLNPVFMGILAFSRKSTFHRDLVEMRWKELREYSRVHRNKRNKILSAVSGLIILFVSILYVGNIVMEEHLPAYIVYKNNEKLYNATAGKVTGTDPVISPRFQDGTLDKSGVRDLYFPDKTGTKEITVYLYMVGSDLEETRGAASVNLAQIVDATKSSSNLRFIVQAGGSGRWFTKGVKSLKTGRYLIQNGEVTLLKDLGWNVCMSKPKALRSFLRWANDKYPSDRRMLFFWDHGAAVSGFGKDHMNPRVDQDMLSMPEIVSALKTSGIRYDLIGFDACLMQSLEVGLCLEPYADYMLASEEGEPSTGMYYTAAFQKLAEEPDLSTVEFGSMMCSSYDQSLKLFDNNARAGSTMSLVDLRFLPRVRKTFFGYLQELDKGFRKGTDTFLSMSMARSKAYEFQMEDQIDLIDFLQHSDISKQKKTKMVNQIKDSIVVRNKASARHINGLAVYMPYNNLYSYDNIHKTLKALGLKKETKIYNDFASIIGGQKAGKTGKPTKYKGNFTYADWFVEDLENYQISVYRQNIPLKKYTGKPLRYENHVIQLPEKDWDMVVNYELGMRIKVRDRYADLGSDNIYDRDEKGHYMVSNDRKWVAINNVLVALHPGTPIEVDDDTTVYTGTVDATLNYIKPITIYLQWVNEGNHEGDGEVLGYLPADEDNNDIDQHGMPRGYKKFKANNTVTFLYDWYAKDGRYLTTAMGHKPILVGTRGLKVTQMDISTEEYEYYGILYDVMGRTMETKHITHKAEKEKS